MVTMSICNTKPFNRRDRREVLTFLFSLACSAVNAFAFVLASLRRSAEHSLPASLRANSSQSACIQDQLVSGIPEHKEFRAQFFPIRPPAAELLPRRSEHLSPHQFRVHDFLSGNPAPCNRSNR